MNLALGFSGLSIMTTFAQRILGTAATSPSLKDHGVTAISLEYPVAERNDNIRDLVAPRLLRLFRKWARIRVRELTSVPMILLANNHPVDVDFNGAEFVGVVCGGYEGVLVVCRAV